MPNFETFTKRMAPLVKQPFVTIQKRGTLSLNAAAHALLGKPDAVELLYDRDEQIVGLRAVPKGSEHAYPLRSQGGKSVGPYIVSGTAFAKYYKIDTEVSRRWVASLVDDVLCIDLKQEGTVVTSNRSASQSADTSNESS
ncbi:hypothetical protein [Streptomyces djakartensis]|uniref:hypothetical protein n=1 Tax=Streptomyces djakartensis TaxID=68193 RepID=UPI0034DFA969